MDTPTPAVPEPAPERRSFWARFKRTPKPPKPPKPLPRLVVFDSKMEKSSFGNHEYEGEMMNMAFVKIPFDQHLEWRRWYSAWMNQNDHAACLQLFEALLAHCPEGYKFDAYKIVVRHRQILLLEKDKD